jgi:hypothetical protein
MTTGGGGGGGTAAPTDPCALKTCMARQATCTDQTYTRYEVPDSCPNGCMDKPKPESCPFGCTNDGCKPDPCAGVVCDSPPKASCPNPTTLRQPATMGTCRNGTCDYPSSDTSCASKSPKCNEGACVACVNDADCSTGDQCLKSACVKAQFILLDETYTATAMNVDSEARYNTTPRFGIPEDWTKPINFTDGMVFVELEILEKPTNVSTLYNICFKNSIDACMPYAPPYTKPGHYAFKSDFGLFWNHEIIDWSKGVSKIQIYLKNDKEEKRPGTDINFYPMKAHVTVTVVAPGATYIPPLL